VIEVASTEYMVRGRGYIRSLQDIETVPVMTDGKGTPVYVRDSVQKEKGWGRFNTQKKWGIWEQNRKVFEDAGLEYWSDAATSQKMLATNRK